MLFQKEQVYTIAMPTTCASVQPQLRRPTIESVVPMLTVFPQRRDAVQLVRVLEKLRARDVSQDYTYYGIASPWLQVKCLRVLQYFPPPEDPAVRRSLTEMLKKMISGETASYSVKSQTLLTHGVTRPFVINVWHGMVSCDPNIPS